MSSCRATNAKPHPPCPCGALLTPADGNRCAPCRERERRFAACLAAFASVAQAIGIVEETARALYETQAGVFVPVPSSEAWNVSVSIEPVRWRRHAFRALSVLYSRFPEWPGFPSDSDDGGDP